MKIEIVVDPARPAPTQSLVSRVAPPPATAATTTPTAKVARLASVPIRRLLSLTHSSRPASRGIRRGRGRARKSNERPQKSVADLDAEMEVCVEHLEFAIQYPNGVIGLHCKQRSCSGRCPCCSLSNVLFAAM